MNPDDCHIDIVLARAAAAMKAAYPEYIAGVDDETYIADLVADLLLLAQLRGVSIEEILERAQMHAEEEVTELQIMEIIALSQDEL